MNGRMYNEVKIETSIENKLKNMPSYVTDWYINLRASRRTASTCRDYINKINRFLKFINEDIKSIDCNDITERIVANFLLSNQIKTDGKKSEYTSDSYQVTIWTCLNNFLGYLYKRGDIPSNYASLIEKPKNHDLDKINKRRVLLTENDFKKILNSIENEKNDIRKYRDKAIVLLLMNTGMRRSALSNITINDVDLDLKTLMVVDKGNKKHEYILSDQVRDALYRWMVVRTKISLKDKTDNHLFISQKGNPISVNTIYDLVEKYTKIALGKPLSPHKLRAGYCSILYNKTHDAEFVRRAVGHANVATTQRYIVTKGDERKKASEIMSSIL